MRGLGGELLEGMSFPRSPSFEVWLAGECRRIQASTEAVLREAALARLATGAAAEAAELAGRLVRRNPLDENVQALLVRSLAAAGDGVGAAHQVAACRDLFERELGVPPGPALDAALRTVTASPTTRPATGRAAAIAQLDAGEPWPQSLRAEVDLLRGDIDAAAERFEHAFALGCQIGDPCWEGIAGRGRGRVAIARGRPDEAVEILLDSIARCERLPDACLWGKAWALDVLCGLAAAQGRAPWRLPSPCGRRHAEAVDRPTPSRGHEPLECRAGVGLGLAAVDLHAPAAGAAAPRRTAGARCGHAARPRAGPLGTRLLRGRGRGKRRADAPAGGPRRAGGAGDVAAGEAQTFSGVNRSKGCG